MKNAKMDSWNWFSFCFFFSHLTFFLRVRYMMEHFSNLTFHSNVFGSQFNENTQSKFAFIDFLPCFCLVQWKIHLFFALLITQCLFMQKRRERKRTINIKAYPCALKKLFIFFRNTTTKFQFHKFNYHRFQ